MDQRGCGEGEVEEKRADEMIDGEEKKRFILLTDSRPISLHSSQEKKISASLPEGGKLARAKQTTCDHNKEHTLFQNKYTGQLYVHSKFKPRSWYIRYTVKIRLYQKPQSFQL